MAELTVPKSTLKKMFWIDMEMTGLDERTDYILEVAIIITDLNFNELETYHRVVFQPKEILENMNDWCKNQHGKSGLTSLVPNGMPLSQVENEILELVDRHYQKDEKVVLCGNSVGQDKKFVDSHMKKFSERCHYRIVDVTSFKEIFRSKYGLEVKKADNHRALEDIRESIEELKIYLSYINEEKAIEDSKKILEQKGKPKVN
jgi:oligoribonuclease